MAYDFDEEGDRLMPEVYSTVTMDDNKKEKLMRLFDLTEKEADSYLPKMIPCLQLLFLIYSKHEKKD